MSSVRDILIVSILFFVIGVSVVLIVGLSHRINDNLVVTPIFNNSAEAIEVIQSADVPLNMSDYMYLALFIGFFLSIMIFGYFVGGHPIMVPIYFFLVVVFVFMAVILQLVWVDLVTSPDILTTTAALPITSFILSHLGYFTVVTGLLGIIAMFAKPSEGL